MSVKTSLLILFVLIHISCSKTTDENPVIMHSNVSANTTPTDIIDNLPTVKIGEADKTSIYMVLLSRIFYNQYTDNLLVELIPSDMIVYKHKTIPPAGIEQIESNPDIRPSLISNFEEANQKSKKLDDTYVLTITVQALSDDSDMITFYRKAKRKYPGTKAVISFSDIGFDESSSKALVYVEYYHPDKGIIKFYILMTLIKRKGPIIDAKYDDIEDLKIFQIQ